MLSLGFLNLGNLSLCSRHQLRVSLSLVTRTLVLILFSFALRGQVARLIPAPLLRWPGIADSNSPSHWSEGKLIVFNSDGMPIRTEGPNLNSLGRARAVRLYSYANAPLWIEATYKAPSGTLYAWYHHEVFLNCPGNPVSAPFIGALRSDDDGKTFFDLGPVLASDAEPDCATPNRYFAGGVGDFSAIADRQALYIYFFFSHYGGETSEQGIATARIAISDLDSPEGQVFKYFEGEWSEPGLGGRQTPIFPAIESWHSENPQAFWGPSIHWNTTLNQYVMLMNFSCCTPDWPAAGIFYTSAPDLSHPELWHSPSLLLQRGGWYPLTMGLGPDGTDKHAGGLARFFLGGESNFWIRFDWD
jgi:hypothetical protein